MFDKRLLLISAGLICLSQLPSTAAAQTFITAWGEFRTPVAVAVGGSGNVYVWDIGNSLVKVFTSAGTFLRQWTPPMPAYGIAVDSHDNVYMPGYGPADAGVICKFTSTGTILNWGGGGSYDYPPSVAVDALDNVYAVASDNRVNVFTSSGAFLREWGVANGAQDLAVDAVGNVYLACGTRVEKYANDGTYLTQWGGGAGDGQFLGIRVAVSPDGHVYVVDNRNSRVQVFTSDGAFVTMWGGLGHSNGQFDNPIGIAVDAHSDIYVADTNNQRIQKFGPGPTPVQGVTWGSMKARYRGAPGAAQPTTQDR